MLRVGLVVEAGDGDRPLGVELDEAVEVGVRLLQVVLVEQEDRDADGRLNGRLAVEHEDQAPERHDPQGALAVPRARLGRVDETARFVQDAGGVVVVAARVVVGGILAEGRHHAVEDLVDDRGGVVVHPVELKGLAVLQDGLAELEHVGVTRAVGRVGVGRRRVLEAADDRTVARGVLRADPLVEGHRPHVPKAQHDIADLVVRRDVVEDDLPVVAPVDLPVAGRVAGAVDGLRLLQTDPGELGVVRQIQPRILEGGDDGLLHHVGPDLPLLVRGAVLQGVDRAERRVNRPRGGGHGGRRIPVVPEVPRVGGGGSVGLTGTILAPDEQSDTGETG